MPPCPHFDLKIVQRSKRQSAVAAAAYQSGERLFSEYDQKQKYYSHKSEIVHTEIMLPPHAPPEYADRNTLWNAAEAIEKQWNSQLARRLVWFSHPIRKYQFKLLADTFLRLRALVSQKKGALA